MSYYFKYIMINTANAVLYIINSNSDANLDYYDSEMNMNSQKYASKTALIKEFDVNQENIENNKFYFKPIKKNNSWGHFTNGTFTPEYLEQH